jgi:glycine/D-amino acid oxidase-like deaminating enzyme
MLAFRSVKETIDSFGIDCFYRPQGRFLMATSSAMYDALLREFDLRARHLGEPFTAVGREDQPSEIGSDLYHGGVRIDDHAGLHPGLYHKGLLDNALSLGVAVKGFTPVTAITRHGSTFELSTSLGVLRARNVLVATNGYTGKLIPWLNKRVIPFDAYIVTTERMDPALLARLLPADRTYIDWNFNVDFIRRTPDDPARINFGGLTGTRVTDLATMAERLHKRLIRIFPVLAEIRIDNVWTGRCAGTFDLYPHIGTHDGIHYALGYCFAGVPMGTWFGICSAQRILGSNEPESVFAGRSFPSHPLYWGNPWFVPLVVSYLSRNDR